MRQLGFAQKPIIQNNYPHMLVEDTIVWTKFLQSGKLNIEKVWYDIHVGKGIDTSNIAESEIKAVAENIYKKRIDVIAQTNNALYVIEIKPYGNMVAYGQALVYSRMFKQEFEVDRIVVPAICCEIADGDIRDDCEQMGIVIFETSNIA